MRRGCLVENIMECLLFDKKEVNSFSETYGQQRIFKRFEEETSKRRGNSKVISASRRFSIKSRLQRMRISNSREEKISEQSAKQ